MHVNVSVESGRRFSLADSDFGMMMARVEARHVEDQPAKLSLRYILL